MDVVSHKTPSPITTPPPLHTSQTNFPIMIAIAIIGILSTCFLVISYYIFVTKCCFNRRNVDLLTRFSFSTRQIVEGPSTVISPPTVENRGLDESAIRSIPILEFKRVEVSEQKPIECAVCLSEFEEEERIRVIPFCGHLFHIDCIDVWLHKNANCPICRASVLAHDDDISFISHWDRIVIPPHQSPSSQHSTDYPCSDEDDYVVIEIESQENSNSGELFSISLSHDRFEKPEISRSEGKNISRFSSMGDSGRSVVLPLSLDP